MKWIRGTGFKLPIQVPLPGKLVLGVDQQRTNPGNVGSLRGSKQSVLEQRFAKPYTLMVLINSKPGQNHHGHRVLRYPFGDTGCGGCWLNAANGQAVESHDRARMAADVRLSTV